MSTDRRFVLLNGFDRSGTSMMAKVLADHPRIECLIQPFSSTVLHRTQWQRWPVDRHAPDVERFVEGLRRGRVDRDFISSDWFDNHSSTTELAPGKLYVIKSTKMHFKVRWWEATFPDVPFWAVWRDPRAVLCSLLRNDFYEAWYGEDAYQEIRTYVDRDDELPKSLTIAAKGAESNVEKMAVIVAVRSQVMVRDVPRERRLLYEEVLDDPNAVLGRFISQFGLEGHDFRDAMRRDHNIVGREFERRDLWRDFFDARDSDRIQEIFQDVELTTNE